jgi:hypothetical protein
LIDWDLAVEPLISAISAKAKKQNIDFITINETPHQISNYDYIRDAFVKFHESIGGEFTSVCIPEVTHARYSPFQGDGEVRILWKNIK